MAQRRSAPTRKQPYFTKRQLEDEADLLLAEFARDRGPVVEPPVPIDDIVELHLGLTIEFKNMQALFGVADVHGALWVNQKKVGVDISLDPDSNPVMLGRYHFTLAHETGHWRLHRHLFTDRANQPSLLPDMADRADYICRSSDTDPLEWQANFFAAALLMPRGMIKSAWHELHDAESVCLSDLKTRQDEILKSEIMRRGRLTMNDDTIDNTLLEYASRPLAERFQVSAAAMRIRLETLGFLQRRKEASLF